MTATLDKARAERIASYNRRTKSPCLPLTDEQRQLVGDNYRLVYGFLRRKCHWLRSTSLEFDDLASILFESLIRAAQTYRPDWQFSTWADWWFRAGLSRWVEQKRRQKPFRLMTDIARDEYDRNDAEGNAPGGEDTADRAADNEAVERCRGYLSDRDWRILEMQNVEGLSNPEIGARLGLSAERVRQLAGRAVRVIRLMDRRREKVQRSLTMPEVAERFKEYVGVCPCCRKTVMWCGRQPWRAERAGLVAEVAHLDEVREKWRHDSACDWVKRRKRVKRVEAMLPMGESDA